MNLNLSPRQRMILVGALVDLKDYASRTPRCQYGNWQLVVERDLIADAKQGFVRTNPSAWLRKSLTPSDHTMISRDYKRLESLGLIERHKLRFTGAHTTHLYLTDSGKALAEQLRAEQSQEGSADGQ